MKIHLIMPMGGAGSRFLKEGFSLPKPMIEISGKPFFYWAVQSVIKNISVLDLTFVILEEHVKKHNLDKKILSFFPNAKIIIIPKLLNGAVLTALEGIKNIDDDELIMFNDCDHAFLCSHFDDYYKNHEVFEAEGGLLTFGSDKPCYSYLRLDSKGEVVGTVEKQVVSSHAICGAYCFKNKNIFKNAADSYLKNCNYAEFFMSGVYNEMVKKGSKILYFDCDKHVPFGTPEEYKIAQGDTVFSQLEALHE